MPRGPSSPKGEGVARRRADDDEDASAPAADVAAKASADAAMAEGDWHLAAELYTKAVNVLREQLQRRGGAMKSEAAVAEMVRLARALSGRARALVEIGQARGELPAQAEVLEAAISDARSASVLARQGGEDDEVVAVSSLCSVLLTAGRHASAEKCVAEALKSHPGSGAFRELQSRIAREALVAKMDADASDGRSPGTFRWPFSMPFPDLPKAVTASRILSVLDKGWEGFLSARGGDALVQMARTNPILLDGLSFPISLAWALDHERCVRWRNHAKGEVLHVVVLGATARAEMRVWLGSKYWQELSHLYAGRCAEIRFHFVGPELDETPDGSAHRIDPPCATGFFEARPELTPSNTVCAIFNGGFGNFVASGHGASLFWSWWPDLQFLAKRKFLCVFFCANDYADLKGEIAIHCTLLRSELVLPPQRNPFSMATVYTGDAGAKGAGKGKQDEWFCGNSYVYATLGGEPRTVKDQEKCERDVKIAAARTDEVEVTMTEPPALLSTAQDAAATAGGPAAVPPASRPAVASASAPAAAPAAPAEVMASPGPAPSAAPAAAPPQERVHSPAVAATPLFGQQEGPAPAPEAKAPQAAMAARAPEVLPEKLSTGEDGIQWVRLEVLLPGVQGIEDADLQISDECLSLEGLPGFAPLQRAWPRAADSTQAVASFSAKRERLVVKVPLHA